MEIDFELEMSKISKFPRILESIKNIPYLSGIIKNNWLIANWQAKALSASSVDSQFISILFNCIPETVKLSDQTKSRGSSQSGWRPQKPTEQMFSKVSIHHHQQHLWHHTIHLENGFWHSSSPHFHSIVLNLSHTYSLPLLLCLWLVMSAVSWAVSAIASLGQLCIYFRAGS